MKEYFIELLATTIQVLVLSTLSWVLLDFAPFEFTFKEWFYLISVVSAVIYCFSRPE